MNPNLRILVGRKFPYLPREVKLEKCRRLIDKEMWEYLRLKSRGKEESAESRLTNADILSHYLAGIIGFHVGCL